MGVSGGRIRGWLVGGVAFFCLRLHTRMHTFIHNLGMRTVA
jgi:hypothetical protein